jgi:hypothetical protein
LIRAGSSSNSANDASRFARPKPLNISTASYSDDRIFVMARSSVAWSTR